MHMLHHVLNRTLELILSIQVGVQKWTLFDLQVHP